MTWIPIALWMASGMGFWAFVMAGEAGSIRWGDLLAMPVFVATGPIGPAMILLVRLFTADFWEKPIFPAKDRK